MTLSMVTGRLYNRVFQPDCTRENGELHAKSYLQYYNQVGKCHLINCNTR